MPPPRAQFPTNGPLRAIIYCRISDDDEGLALGVTRQEEDGRALAASLGATVVAVYTDNDIGASTRSRSKPRPGYNQMHADVHAGLANCVIYYTNSRLTRRPMEYEEIIQLVEQTGVRLASIKSNNVDLTTADGRQMGRIQAAIDAGEVERAAERIQRKLQQNREMGKVHGGRLMTGWLRPDPKQDIGIMTHLDPVAVEKINTAADWLLSGVTVSRAVTRWQNSGFKTLAGAEWMIGTFQSLMSNPRLAGLVAYRGEIVGEGNWPAVMDRAKWEAVQPFVRAHGKRPFSTARKFLLSGFILCGKCGTTLSARQGNKSDRQMRYACIRSSRGGCGGISRNMAWLESVVRTYVESCITIELEAAPVEVPRTVESERLTGEIEGLETRLAEARDAAGAGLMSMIDAGIIMSDLREQITKLRDSRGQAVATERRDQRNPVDLRAQWARDDLDTLGERRDILSRYVKQVMVHPLEKGRKWTKENMPLDSITIIPA
ncbi:recombinase family protein [Streptosporangium sp. OZ121]|uniref:recombinase family protein n=1 Tax=Streptosporangium sp. OZ121 TaxID=3444183 RepID=UPI003F7ABF84